MSLVTVNQDYTVDDILASLDSATELLHREPTLPQENDPNIVLSYSNRCFKTDLVKSADANSYGSFHDVVIASAEAEITKRSSSCDIRWSELDGNNNLMFCPCEGPSAFQFSSHVSTLDEHQKLSVKATDYTFANCSEDSKRMDKLHGTKKNKRAKQVIWRKVDQLARGIRKVPYHGMRKLNHSQCGPLVNSSLKRILPFMV